MINEARQEPGLSGSAEVVGFVGRKVCAKGEKEMGRDGSCDNRPCCRRDCPPTDGEVPFPSRISAAVYRSNSPKVAAPAEAVILIGYDADASLRVIRRALALALTSRIVPADPVAVNWFE